jgi:DNA-binding HxlR family transcriptional regulator
MVEKPKNVRRSPCPVACSLDLIGDKWTLLVVRDLLLGRSHFKDFEASPEGIATNILANRLARLVASGLAEKYRSPEQKDRAAYRLTEKGKSLEPVVGAIAEWGLAQIDGTRIGMQRNAD